MMDLMDPEFFFTIDEKMVAIGEIRGTSESIDITLEDEGSTYSLFKHWKILEVLTALLTKGPIIIQLSVADCVGLVGVPEEFGGIRTTLVQFNKMRDKVLNLLRAGLVPY